MAHHAADADEREDADLVAAAVADAEAFAPLYRRHVGPVHRYCYRRLGERTAAEDATALVFTKALTSLAAFRGDGSFRAWLLGIAHHVTADRLRERRRDWEPVAADWDAVDPAQSPEALAVDAAERADVQALVAHLPEGQRRVVELRLAGLTGAEIAAALGCSRGAVDAAQFRAVARLRRLLGVAPAAKEAAHDGR